MKILHWDEMFHPTFGYQINLLAKFQAMAGHDVTIFTSDNIENHPTFSTFGNKIDIQYEDKIFTQKYGVKIVRLPIYGVISGRVIYKSGYLKKIKQEKPDVVMCHTNDTLSGMNITRRYKKLNMPVVFDNHMLEMASKNPLSSLFRNFFKKIITPVITENKLIVIKTQNDDYINKFYGIPEELTPFISFGSDTSNFYPNDSIKKKFRKENNISENDFVITYTGKLTEDKGSKILALAMLDKIKAIRDVTFIVVGNANGEYEQAAKKIMEQSKNNVVFFPTQRYNDLPQFYQASDLSVFPKQSSLSFYDAQACGLPVIAEDNNVNVDRLNYRNGLTFKSGNSEDFRKKIIEIVNLSPIIYKEMSKNAYLFVKENYDYQHIANQYTDILKSEYNRFYFDD